MIREIKIPHLDWKRNWIDQNNVVFGYGDTQCCCESWGWGVYDADTREKVADSPSGMAYHFDFDGGATATTYYDEPSDEVRDTMLHGRDAEYIDHLDVVRVGLIPDEGTDGKRLVFEAYTDHNGYYLHDFSFEKSEGVEEDEERNEV